MKIEKIVVGLLEENCYVISDINKNALIIDPGDEFLRIKDFVKDYTIKGILITHFHFDHIGALADLEGFYHLKANDFEAISDFDFKVLPTPGHTDDSLSFYFPEDNVLFSGDFVFKNGIGRTDLGGSDDDMKKSLSFLLTHFNDDVQLFPGHGASTILGKEKVFLNKLIIS